MGFFSESFAVSQWCHNRGWTSLSPLCLLRRQLTMEHSAGGDPDPLIVLWQPWPSQREDKKQHNTACRPAHHLFQTKTPIYHQCTPLHTRSSAQFTVMQALQLKTSPSCITMPSMPSEYQFISATALACFYYTVLLFTI